MSPVPTHHPAEDTLLRYVAGTLPSGHALVVATHLPFCPRCRESVRLCEAVGGVLLAATPHVELSSDALTRTLTRLDAPLDIARPDTAPTALTGDVPLPETLRGLTRPPWRWLAPGVGRIGVNVPLPFPDARGGPRQIAAVLRIAPGRSLPAHSHRGWEATCVLAGRFTDVTGAYGPGDVAEMEGDSAHRPISGPEQTCVCLIAWVGRLRMRGLIARLAQPLLGV
jgi:putative transcriptional regulator